jgi:hypothetical protein
MTCWEIDVEMIVRKTLIVGGPRTEEAARDLAEMILAGDLNIHHFTKWNLDAIAGRAVPTETIIGGDPRIVAVREVPEHAA